MVSSCVTQFKAESLTKVMITKRLEMTKYSVLYRIKMIIIVL